jgi:hypothetical protein
VVGRGGKEKQTFMFLLETVPICSPYEHAWAAPEEYGAVNNAIWYADPQWCCFGFKF